MSGKRKHPRFGDRIRGIYAGETNPQREGTFVEVVRRKGLMNSGVFYRLTDERGTFWLYPAENTEPAESGHKGDKP